MNAGERYISIVKEIIDFIETTQAGEIEKAAVMTHEALKNGGFVFTFGTGHSHILAEEIFYRAGGLARIYPILEDALMLHKAAARSSALERVSGLASALLDDVDAIRNGGILFLFSNSGCNTVAVEMAEEAKKRGLKTVCVTNVTHSKKMISRHPKGLKLMDVCDVVIDNKGCYGDAAVEINDTMTGPTSTVAGAMIMEAIVCRAVELSYENGEKPEVFASANTIGGDQKNAGLIAKYKPLVKPL
ncbi:MAG: SIS domain-containing protein [Clostridiales bacterium]|nr:SIS domain-containing protein [Clostridiales bacterium]